MDTGQHGQIDGGMSGQVLGDRYQLLTVLGSGGMGTVYKATHLGLGRAVAIKLLHPHIVGDERSVQRFNQEMQAMSALNHPHLIAITDAGITRERAPYFVMEYLEGQSLSDELDRGGNLQEAIALKIALQIADALDYAHNKGIVHRDLKPNNIMLVGRNDFVKVVDLGIAKLASINTSSDSLQKLTQTGEIFGSPLYMSPEQCLGKSVDYRADIYGLGCLIYEMVSNNLPINGETPIETLMHHINDPPRPLSQVPGLMMTPSLVALDQIIMHCLEKDPARRFQSMAELHRALEQVQQGASTGGYVAPLLNEQRETRISQGQIVPPIYGGSPTPPPRVEHDPGNLSGGYAPPVPEPADPNYNYRQAPTVDLSGQHQQNISGNQSFATGQITGQDLSQQRQTGGSASSNNDDWRRTSGGGAFGLSGPGTVGDTGSRTDGIAGSAGVDSRSPGSLEKYVPMMIICATVVIGIIGIASVMTVLQPHNAPVVQYSSSDLMAKSLAKQEREMIAKQREIALANSSLNRGSEGVELSSGDVPVPVFMVAEYMGIRPEEFKDIAYAKEYGETTVVVKYDKKPMVLFLSGYCPVKWVVKRESSNVNIQKIYVSGYFAPKVDAPPGVPVEKSWFYFFDENSQKTDKRHENPFPFFALSDFQDVKDKGSWREVAASVKQATGQEVYKFWGKYFGDKFIVE